MIAADNSDQYQALFFEKEKKKYRVSFDFSMLFLAHPVYLICGEHPVHKIKKQNPLNPSYFSTLNLSYRSKVISMFVWGEPPCIKLDSVTERKKKRFCVSAIVLNIIRQ